MDLTEKSGLKAELEHKSFQLPSVVYSTRNYGGKKLLLKTKKQFSRNNSVLMLHKKMVAAPISVHVIGQKKKYFASDCS